MDGHPGADATVVSDHQTFSTHYRRLQSIEQNVVRAIEAASYVMSELSSPPDAIDRENLHLATAGFIKQIQEAQQLVLEGIKAAAPERTFEANNYFPMIQALVAAEKLDAVSVHISGINKVLRQLKQQPAQGSAGTAAATEPGAEPDAMEV